MIHEKPKQGDWNDKRKKKEIETYPLREIINAGLPL